jgi:ribulose-5-phosphate 4-epimerase/fuculose-1-phosphate aldolase
MKIGRLPLIPYFPPGDINLAKAVREMASEHHAVLLANHGPVVAGKTLEDAVYAIEELEETARLFLLLKNVNTQYLNEDQARKLTELFPN